MSAQFRPIPFVCMSILAMALLPSISGADWVPGFHIPGADDDIQTMIVHDGELYLGGRFLRINDQSVTGFAKWDGSTLTDLNPGDAWLWVIDMTVWRGEIYVLNSETVYHWTGSSLDPITTHHYFGSYYDLEVWDDKLIVGGSFDRIEEVDAHCVAAWDGDTWSPLADGVGTVYTGVRDLVIYEGDLVAIGYFRDDNNNNPLDGIARFDGTSWGTISGVQNVQNPRSKNAVVVHEGDLYVAFDSFDGTIEGQHANLLARWDGITWHNEGNALGNSPSLLFSHPQGLIVVGSNLNPHEPFLGNLCFYDGQAVSTVGGGLRGFVMAAALYQDLWYFGGDFEEVEYFADPLISPHLATFDGDQCQAFPNNWGNGISGDIEAMAMIGNDLYIGGSIRGAGASSIDNIARWDGQQWWPVPNSWDVGFFYTMTNWNDQLVVSGTNGVFLLDQGEWQPLQGGVALCVAPRALYEFEGDLIAGAWTGETSTTPLVQRWDGSQWQDMGGPHSGVYVHQFLQYEGDILAAGQIYDHGNLCRWVGDRWFFYGGGVDAAVFALVEYRGDLVIGGKFNIVGGLPISNIARFHNGVWLSPGAGLNNDVIGLAASPDWLYASGDFTASGDMTLSHLASWNEWTDPWHYMAGGTNVAAQKLLLGPEGLYTGGSHYFTIAGELPVGAFSLWTGELSPVGYQPPTPGFALAAPYPNPFNPCTNLEFSLDQPGFARLEIFDVRGRLVRQLLASHLDAGLHHLQWDGCDASGRPASGGIYFARFKANEEISTQKLTLVK